MPLIQMPVISIWAHFLHRSTGSCGRPAVKPILRAKVGIVSGFWKEASALCSEFKDATVSSRSSSGISFTASPPMRRLSPAGVINKFNVDGAVD